VSKDVEPLGAVPLKISVGDETLASVEVTTDPSGDFELFNVPPGDYVVSGSIHFGTGVDKIEQKIEISPPGREAPRRLAITTTVDRGRRGDYPTIPADWEAPVAIVGKVLSHDGEALSNIKLVVTPPEKEEEPRLVAPSAFGARAHIRREAVTGLDGSYRLLALPPGRYTVALYNNDFPSAEPIEKWKMEIKETPMHRDFRVSGVLPAAKDPWWVTR
jgi:hypothetical protein